MANVNEDIADIADETEDSAESFVLRKPLTALALAMLVGAVAAKIAFRGRRRRSVD